MYLRILVFLLLLPFCFSCEFIENQKEEVFSLKKIDTVIDFTKVDVLPSFSICDSILEVAEKNRCFINNLHTQFSENLLMHTFDVPDSINEIVIVQLKIDAKGGAVLISIQSSEMVKKVIPSLDEIITKSVYELPILFPALKRGIPVATEYKIPIVIKL